MKQLTRFTRKLIWLATYPVLRQIRKLENLHSGEECYIFGDGSSIKQFDISVFSDKISIAVNAFPRHKDVRNLNLRYWIVAEAGFFLPPLIRTQGNYPKTYKDRLRFQSFYRRQPRDSSDLVQITSITNLPGLWGRRTYYFWDHLPQTKSDCENPRTNLMFAGSVCAALTIAQYLGFKKAYLIGFDYTHNPPTAQHWYENTSSILSPHELGDFHEQYFNTMMKYIEIVTVTPSPQFTKLPSIDYKLLTDRDLGYRENTELLTRDDLDVLALVPHYKIFGDATSCRHQ